jgi:hypothetical protein
MVPGSVWSGGLSEFWNALALPGMTGCHEEASVTVTGIAHLSQAPAGESLGLRPLFSAPVDPETPDIELVVLKDKKHFLGPTVHLAALPSAVTLPRGGSIPLYLAHRSLLC